MAQFKLAKFLSEALEWKIRFPKLDSYGGLHYKSFIYPWARKVFINYSRLYPDDSLFNQKIVRDLINKDPQLLKLVNPESITPEQSLAETQFKAEAQIEQKNNLPPEGQPSSQKPALSDNPAGSPGIRSALNPATAVLEEDKQTMASDIEKEQPLNPWSDQTITPIPEAFSKAFEDVPEGLLNPSQPRTKMPASFEKAFAAAPAHTTDPDVKPAGATSSRSSFKLPKIPTSFINTAKNIGSSSGRFFYKNIGSKISLNTAVTGFTTILGGIVGSKFGAAGLAAGAVGGGFLPSFVKSGAAGPMFSRMGTGILNFGSRFSSQTSKLSSRIPTPTAISPGKRIVVALLLSMVGLMFGISVFGALFSEDNKSSATTAEAGTIGSGCPDTSTNIASCRYLNPSIDLFNNSLSQSSMESYINKYSPVFINSGKGNLTEFRKRVNYIVSSSQTAGLNPAIFLGYWKSESNFSTLGSRDMGCVGDSFYEQVDCALGINQYSDPAKNPIANCARSRDANGVACTTLKSIRKTFDQTHPVQYPIATIDDFAESYGPYGDLTGGAPTNCTHTYNTLIDVSKELNACKVSSTPLASSQSNITGNAAKITQLLSKGSDRFFNVKKDEPGVYYWCTYLIVDSYNQAGFNNLSRSLHASVLAMKSFFANTSGYKLLPADTPAGQLRSGNVIFFEGSGDQHVSLINAIDLDQQGNGIIKTYESNNVTIEDAVFVKGFKAISAQTTANKYAITGFGQAIQ